MSASYQIQVTITRFPDPNDPKPAFGPKSYNVALGPGIIDQEISVKLAPGASGVVVPIPAVGTNTQLVLVAADKVIR